MGSATSLAVEVDQTSYYGGDQLTGRVLLRVMQPDKVHADQLELRFEGAERTKVVVEQGSGKHKRRVTHRSSHLILRMDVVLAKFDSHLVLAKGDYVFPFSLSLPLGIPAGFSFRYSDHSCSVRYTAVAVLSQPGMMWGTSEHKSQERDIRIEGTHIPTVPVQQIINPRADKIVFCCCFNSGTLHSGGSVSTNCVHNGETIKVNIAFENHSTSRMKAVEVTFQQNVFFKADHHSKSFSQALAYTRLAPEQLGTMWEPITQAENKTNTAAGFVNDAEILLKLSDAIAKGTCGNATLDIVGATNTHRGSLITVGHELIIRIATPFCVSDPEHHTWCYVQAPPRGMGLSAGNAYQIAFAEPTAPPKDWNPQVINSMPMASAVVVTTGLTPPSTTTTTTTTLKETELLQQLDKTYPLAAYGTLVEWFAINEDLKVLPATSLANIFLHVVDPATKIRVAAFLATRLEQISIDHLVAVAQVVIPIDKTDASCTGTRWSIIKHLATKCTDRENYSKLSGPLKASDALVKTMF